MRRHIIRPFNSVFVIWRIFRYGVIQMLFQIGAHVRADVFINRQRSRSMLDKEVQKANLNPAQFGKVICDLTRHDMKAA